MIDWLGIGHLFELSGTEAIAGFFTPLVIFAAFFLAQLILPGRWVPGYVINPETGEPRRYRLNGILVFAIALIVWALELTGMPRDWFYRSSIYAVADGTVFTAIFAVLAVFSQPQGEAKNPIAALGEDCQRRSLVEVPGSGPQPDVGGADGSWVQPHPTGQTATQPGLNTAVTASIRSLSGDTRGHPTPSLTQINAHLGRQRPHTKLVRYQNNLLQHPW